MTSEFQKLRNSIKAAEFTLAQAQNALHSAERNCKHEWGKVVNDPIITPGYEYGDEPGTMGSDYRPKTWVPATSTPRYRRTCTVCGRIEETSATDEVVTKTKVPRF